MERILIVEDEVKISRLIELQLKHEGYITDTAFDGSEGLTKIEKNNYDLVLLDLMLPRIDGIEVCNRVRQFSDIPIIMLTAKDDVRDKVSGLDTGADDYLTKPFSIDELSARIKALLRRPKKIEQEVYKLDDLILDVGRHIATRGDKEIYLARKEFALLNYLLKNKGIVLSRSMIMEHVWDMSADPFSNTIESHIVSLRKKIDTPGKKKLIHTIQGRGYKIDTKANGE